jgi:CubicO group peptidase (beta-lactamase class C family)
MGPFVERNSANSLCGCDTTNPSQGTSIRYWKVAIFAQAFFLLTMTIAAARQPQDEDAREAIGERISTAVVDAGKSGFSGVVLAEFRGEVIAVVAVGSKGDSGKGQNTTETVFEIASVTKPITAVALFVLAQQGKLTLDDPIHNHLPNVPDNCKEIKIKHLLQHTSGIPGSNLGPPKTDLSETVPIFLEGGPRSKPGTKFEYWNQGYILLSAIIASANRTEYTDAIRQLVYQPNGMTKSCFTGDPISRAENVAIGQTKRGASRSALQPPYGDSYDLTYRGTGGAVCDVSDLHKLVRAIRSGNFLKDDNKKAMLQPGDGGYGLGWFVESVSESQRRIYHTGGVRGFLSSVSWYPEDDCSVIVLSNNDDPTPFLSTEIACRDLLEAEVVKHPKSQLFSREFVASMEGQYVLGRRVVSLTVAGSRIKMLFDWGGPKTAGVLEKRDRDKLFFATVTNESLELTLGTIENGRVSSFKMMDAEFRRK